ncbi:hypothetical protein AmDm5_2215 [Acetobacter malorum]|nr:hypothetical protein AmDm5_2215 [Acetobacter malorum]
MKLAEYGVKQGAASQMRWLWPVYETGSDIVHLQKNPLRV